MQGCDLPALIMPPRCTLDWVLKLASKTMQEAYLRVPVSSQVYVLYTAMLLLLAATKRCPPLLKQQSLHAFIWNSASCLQAASVFLMRGKWPSSHCMCPDWLQFPQTGTTKSGVC